MRYPTLARMYHVFSAYNAPLDAVDYKKPQQQQAVWNYQNLGGSHPCELVKTKPEIHPEFYNMVSEPWMKHKC